MKGKLEEPRVRLVDGNLKRLALTPSLHPDLQCCLCLVRLVPQGAHIRPVAEGLTNKKLYIQPIRRLSPVRVGRVTIELEV